MTKTYQNSYYQDYQLEKALDQLDEGIPLEKILAQAGDDAVWLGPLLEISEALRDLLPENPLPDSSASYERMMAHQKILLAHSKRAARKQTTEQASGKLWSWLQGGFMPRLATSLATVLIIFLVLGSGLTLSAQNALPGQTLYPVKRLSEDMRLTLTINQKQRDDLAQVFNQRRIEETKQLLEQGQEEEVAFEENISDLETNTLVVAGVDILFNERTEIIGTLRPDGKIRVEGVTQDSQNLVAEKIIVLDTATDLNTPTSTRTLTATPEPHPTMTNIATLSPIAASNADVVSQTSPVQTPSSSTQVSFTSTATPIPIPPSERTRPTKTMTNTPIPTLAILPPETLLETATAVSIATALTTSTPEPRATYTSMSTNVSTSTNTLRPTFTPTPTETVTSTHTATLAPSDTSSSTATQPPIATSTTAVITLSVTPTAVPTMTLTITPTTTPSVTPSATPVETPSNTPSPIPTVTSSTPPSGTPPHTATPLDNGTASPTETATQTLTPEPTLSPTPTPTKEPDGTNKLPTITPTPVDEDNGEDEGEP